MKRYYQIGGVLLLIAMAIVAVMVIVVSAPVRTGPKKSCGIIATKEVQNGPSKQVVSREKV